METAKEIQVQEKSDIYLFMSKYGAAVVFAILIIFNAFYTDNFFTINTFLLLMKQTAGLSFLAVGMTMVLSTGGIDISVGSLMAFCGVIAGKTLHNYPDANVWLVLLMALAVCCIIGLFNGLMISKVGIPPIILTLVMMKVLSGAAIVIANQNVFSLSFSKELNWLCFYKVGGVVPIQGVFLAILIPIAYYLVKMTKFGKYVEAIGENSKAAHLSGVDTSKVITLVYVLSALMAGFCSIITFTRTIAVDPNELGVGFELNAIAAVAIGGTSMTGGKSNLIGSFAGAFVITLLSMTVSMNNIPFGIASVLKMIVLIAAFAVQRKRSS